MRIEQVPELEAGRALDEAIRPAFEQLEQVERKGRFRGVLFVYDEEEDEATMLMFGYKDDAHVVMDADAIAVAARGANPHAN